MRNMLQEKTRENVRQNVRPKCKAQRKDNIHCEIYSVRKAYGCPHKASGQHRITTTDKLYKVKRSPTN